MNSSFRLFLRLFRESFLFAFEALRVNKLRTTLSLLGITIGIFAIISVFTVTDALERKIRKDVETLGNNVVYIDKWAWVPESGGEYPWWKYLNRPVPNYAEMNELNRRTATHDAIAYIANFGSQTLKCGSSSAENVSVSGVSHEYDRIKSFELQDGRYFSEHESENGSPIVIIGSEVNDALFPLGNGLGKQIVIDGLKFSVIGIIRKEGSSMIGNSSDNMAIIPINYARKLFDLHSMDVDQSIMVKAGKGISMQELRDDLRGNMRSIRKLKPKEEDDFTLNETSLLSNGLKSLFSTLDIAGWIIGGFSILVGGFGIANIMFVSVKERTPIIGIQKSLGSKDYFILLQFLVEAIVLCIFGGCIGLLMVFGLSILASKAVDFDLSLTIWNVLMGITISATVGILSGFFPAWKASRMNPVDAIRAT